MVNTSQMIGASLGTALLNSLAVTAVARENVTQTIEHLDQLKRILDTDAEHFDDQTD